MNDLLIFALLFVAIACGWFLGRRSSSPTASGPEMPSEYYRGLNYLLEGRPDGAVDSFIDALEVNSETLETHLALGNLLRKRGEVDRAIRVHQNLLARPSLPRSQVHLAHLELSRDYISAGLLDRAENLLLTLVAESVEQRNTSRRYLLEIYQSEREWQRAIDIAKALLPKKNLLGASSTEVSEDKGQQIRVVIAHYYCELAQEKLDTEELQLARSLLEQALNYDRECVRASIMLGDIECKSGQFKRAIKALQRVRLQDVDLVPETIATLRHCYQQLGDEAALQKYLEECFGSDPSPNLLLAVAEDVRESDGEEAAAEFLASRLADQPSLRGIARLISLQLHATDGAALDSAALDSAALDSAAPSGASKDNLDLLQLLVNRLISERPLYRCDHCGFSGQQLHWSCPSCQYWGSMKTIRSVAPE